MLKTALLAIAMAAALAAQTNSNQETAPALSRWLDIQTATIGLRYATEQSPLGAYGFRQIQHHEEFSSTLRLDRSARFTIHTGISSGAAFNGGWDNTPAGGQSGSFRPYWKTFFMAAKVADGIGIQYGGLGIERGIVSPVIGYSDNGYITGQRLILQKPASLFFDDIAITYGFLGDLNHPGMNDRFRRLGQINFRQFSAAKTFAHNIQTKVDYTDQWGRKTLVEALKIDTHRSRLADSVQVELYQRTNPSAAQGFHVAIGKSLKKVTATAGYASIDRDYGDLNDDAFLHGNKVYVSAGYKVSPMVSFFVLANHAVENNYPVPNRTHIHFGISYDVVQAFRKAAIL